LDDDAPTFEEEGKEIPKIIRKLRPLIQLGRALGTNDIYSLSINMNRVALKLHAMNGKRLCIISQGYFGVAPQYSQEGDQIWAFSGAPNPFILQPFKDPSTISDETVMYELVGACYIHGIMYRELEHL
jgi:hypothetical protein